MSEALVMSVTVYCSSKYCPITFYGGYGAVIATTDEVIEITGGYQYSTCNRMELHAVLNALQEAPHCATLLIHSHSRYVVDGVKGRWVKKWQKSGWKTREGKKVRNQDLWIRLQEELTTRSVKLKWLRANDNHSHNQLSRSLATKGMGLCRLPYDAY